MTGLSWAGITERRADFMVPIGTLVLAFFVRSRTQGIGGRLDHRTAARDCCQNGAPRQTKTDAIPPLIPQPGADSDGSPNGRLIRASCNAIQFASDAR